MTIDLVVKNGKVVTSRGISEVEIAIDDGKIISICKESHLPEANKVIDVEGMIVMPGAIDPHVHFGSNNRFEEDVPDSTSAQAVGGITSSFASLQDKRPYKNTIPEYTEVLDNNSYVDVTLYAYVMTMEHINELGYAIESGITSFKHFTNRPEYEKMGISYLSDGEMFLSFERIKELGGVAMVHCEDFGIAQKLMERLKNAGRNDLAAWNDCRPDFIEHKKIVEATYLAFITGCSLYIPHTTIGTVKEIVDWAHIHKVKLYIETCPAYLSKIKTDRKIGLLGKVNPPIRTKSHVEKLWVGIMEGWVDCIGTDHCPITIKRKRLEGDIWSAAPGYPGSETLLPFMISEGYNKRGVPLERIVELTSTKTAEIHGIPNKGDICIGYDADLVIVNLKKRVRADDKILQFSNIRDVSLFEGEIFNGYPIMTIVRGNVIAENFVTVGKRGYGKIFKRRVSKDYRKPTLNQLLD